MVFMKKPLFVFSVCILLLSLVGCENSSTPALDKQTQSDIPPTLKILYQDISITAERVTYSWPVDNKDGTVTGIEYDSVAPPKLAKNATPLTVPPKSLLTLSFSDKPINVTVNIWHDAIPVKQSVIDDTIVASDLKGEYIYEIIGTWKKGISYYVFSINVD